MKGWQSHCDPTEIGCRGFVAQSLCKALTKLGFIRSIFVFCFAF